MLCTCSCNLETYAGWLHDVPGHVMKVTDLYLNSFFVEWYLGLQCEE